MSARINKPSTRFTLPFLPGVSEASELAPAYHTGKGPTRTLELETRQFIVWDGEGARAPGKRKPQNFVLFGYYDGFKHESIIGERLSTYELLPMIIKAGREHPKAWHVSFAFGYDINMILRNLSPKQFQFLRTRGYTRVGAKWRVEHIPGKWFRVTEYGPNYPEDKTDRFGVTIFDTWGFFQSSLVAALKSYIPDHELMARLPEIEAGKDLRAKFTYEDIEYIKEYWGLENVLFHALINRLRDYLYSVDLRISKWHGPGALASYAYRTNRVKPHKSDCGNDVYNAARYAYAGGRFERFHIGRFTGAYGYDINSAYPYAIAQLPSLSEGQWIHVDNPKHFSEFGVYRVAMRGPGIARAPAPLFHRDPGGNITYPWRLDGWYWSPELRAMADTMPEFANVAVYEGWEYVGWTTRPFAFVADLYNQRREMKRDGIGAQIALKLLLNSLYGKMAQRAGWERTGTAPVWHQLEWAGWVTSSTRATLFRLMHSIPWSQLIAVETDGIFTTATPDELSITDSKELGGWEITEYDELVYLQSGVYAKRQGEEWSMKFRGLDADSVSVEQIVEHAKLLVPGRDWPNLVGTTTRFIGYQNAMFREQQNRGPMKVHHCVWETEPREISCGTIGKRVHSPKICAGCKAGKSAYDMPHETVIKSRTLFGTDTDSFMSTQHDIPWLDEKKMASRFAWREMQDSQEGLLSV